MASQAYTFPLLSAFVGTMASSQPSQRNTYTANLTLTLKPERQPPQGGFLGKGTENIEFVLLMHTGPQQLVRWFLTGCKLVVLISITGPALPRRVCADERAPHAIPAGASRLEKRGSTPI